jgi:hypothetical protein
VKECVHHVIDRQGHRDEHNEINELLAQLLAILEDQKDERGERNDEREEVQGIPERFGIRKGLHAREVHGRGEQQREELRDQHETAHREVQHEARTPLFT